MTDDLVKRLREYGDWPQDVLYREWAEWSHKAADRIEKLEAALREIDRMCDTNPSGMRVGTWMCRPRDIRERVAQALEGEDD